MNKQKILIVDDSELNRALLAEILEGEYDVTEAENGLQAIHILAEHENDFFFVLLDIVMPVMDGFGVLNYINAHYWNDRVVVMMISSDESAESIGRAYELGAFDYISRPFDPMIVRKRIANTLRLYARQDDLEQAVKAEFYEKQKSNDLMISLLSHIVEFRNGESGMHIQHVRRITELLLRRLAQLTEKYQLTESDISLISMASAIHDVGKISIPEEVLNKPGKLTAEEFAAMKTHTVIGAQMLDQLPIEQFDSPLAKLAHDICRWHHERYDGRGYPDGLKGDETPIAAQVVALADVYDALTSERCYKKAYSHEEAIQMILDGQCGAFNPLLLKCLSDVSDTLKRRHEGMDAQGDTLAPCVKGGHAAETPSAEPEYMQLLYVDPVTKLYNRRYYQEHICGESAIAAVALFRVQALQKIQNACGNDAADALLRLCAQALLPQIRRTDHLIRYAGDVFLIAFSSMEDAAFQTRLEQIRSRFDALTFEAEPAMRISVSVGGACGALKPEALTERAKLMLIRSQKSGQTEVRVLEESAEGKQQSKHGRSE